MFRHAKLHNELERFFAAKSVPLSASSDVLLSNNVLSSMKCKISSLQHASRLTTHATLDLCEKMGKIDSC